MQENEIVRADILGFRTYLINMERSARTIDKYCRDVYTISCTGEISDQGNGHRV